METFENMAQRSYLDIYPNCAQNGAVMNLSAFGAAGVKGTFMRKNAERTIMKTSNNGFFVKLMEGLNSIADEQGSVLIGSIKNKIRGSENTLKQTNCESLYNAYIPDMKLSAFNR